MCSDLRTIAKSMTRVAKRRDDTGGSRVIEMRESIEDREVDSGSRGTIRVVDLEWSNTKTSERPSSRCVTIRVRTTDTTDRK